VSGALVDLDLLWGARVEELRDSLHRTPDPRRRVALVEAALLRQLAARGRAHDPGRLHPLFASVGTLADASVRAVAEAYGLTHRRVIALFDHHVGLKPKAYHRVQRLRRVLEVIGAGARGSWAQVAIQAGYCDQAHLINDFRKLTGLTPRAYERTRTSVGDGFVPHRVVARG
jgi:transcriptional regulator GlxA family with amidase domain